MKPIDSAKSLGTPGLAMGCGGWGCCRDPSCGLRPLMLEVPGTGGLKAGAEKPQKPVGVGLHAAAHHSGIFQIALFFKGIAQSPAAASTGRKPKPDLKLLRDRVSVEVA